MASLDQRLASNVDGDFFVDASCIDCDTCRWMAPEIFDSEGDQARVHRQPAGARELHRALSALVSCPTASIGTRTKHDLAPVLESFPQPIDGEVHHCGFHAEESFGAAAYLIVRPDARGGNVLVDVPRFTEPLVRRIEALGGVRTMFLTHQDDVADHARYAARFGARRVIHADDVTDDTRGCEVQLEGEAAVALDGELLAFPTPGHTRGSMCLCYRERYLFSGDHLAWSPEREHVYAFRSAVWYDWRTQIASMERLARLRFEWILPGHGRRCYFPEAEMRGQMRRCIEWMKAAS